MPVGAFGFIDRIGRVLRRGYALCIDYGGIGTSGGEVHGYRGHRVVDDVLASPGETDITVGVDFAAIAERAEDAGLPSVSERDAARRV